MLFRSWSSGSAEAGALSKAELERVYRIGVECCKGRVPVYGNPPERQTVTAAAAHIRLAIDCGVEAVNVYGPPGWHAFRPTDAEYSAFFDALLPRIDHPVLLSPNPDMGYTPRPALVSDIVRRHRNIVGLNLNNHKGDGYFIALRERMERPLDINVSMAGSLPALLLGASGIEIGRAHV